MKYLRIVSDGLHVPFMKYNMLTFSISAFLIVATLIGWFIYGINFGIDFTGGSLLNIRRTSSELGVEDVRNIINNIGIVGANVQEFKGTDDMQIRLSSTNNSDSSIASDHHLIVDKVKDALGSNFELRSVDIVGPAVSDELRRDAFIAVCVSMLLVFIYLWLRFEWQYALGAVLTTLHDVILTFGFIVYFQITFNLPILAAILTIVGYSLNDTVVIYDRIREVMASNANPDSKLHSLALDTSSALASGASCSISIRDIIDTAISQTLSRTVMTSVTVLIAALALLIWGGESLYGFNLIMVLGVLIGTYSSIVIAAPLLVILKLNVTMDAMQKASSQI